MLSRHFSDRLSLSFPAACQTSAGGHRISPRCQLSTVGVGRAIRQPLAPNNRAILGSSLKKPLAETNEPHRKSRVSLFLCQQCFWLGEVNLLCQVRHQERSTERQKPTVTKLWFFAWGHQGGSFCTPQPPSPGKAADSEVCCAAKAASPECGSSVAAKESRQLRHPPLHQTSCRNIPFPPEINTSTAKHLGREPSLPG